MGRRVKARATVAMTMGTLARVTTEKEEVTPAKRTMETATGIPGYAITASPAKVTMGTATETRVRATTEMATLVKDEVILETPALKA